MIISLIVAMSENQVIGFKERLPWGSLPKDLENLFEVSKGCKMIMGRKSYESEDRISSKSGNYVISRQKDFKVEEGFKVKSTLDEALIECSNEKEIFILGGGEIFKKAILIADYIHLTLIHTNFEGDTYFPKIDSNLFNIKSIQKYSKDENHKYDFSFIIYKKKGEI